ncbi:tetratricopeptide repeat protein [Calycomorphotria hydatis]|uniref:Tetratricopeptide repeat protein n=1 Tax=Calycomorphotria hydatis TaxID=2528027 RepID=A0A517T3E1_9PLAN|nr:tetratricopeptide repeat protein [Calycomorphotria hydatis]
MKRFNWKFLAILAVVVLVCAGATHAVHLMQVDRVEATLKKRAVSLEETDSSAALKYFNQYLLLVPDDHEVRAKVANLTIEQANSQNDYMAAFRHFEQLLRSEPERTRERRQLIELLLQLGRFKDAEYHTDILAEVDANLRETGDAEIEFLRGVCAQGRKKYDRAEEYLRQAIDGGYREVQAYGYLANLLDNELNKSERAEEVLDEMVAARPQDPEAYLTRAGYRLGKTDYSGARKDARRAESFEGDQTEVALVLAQVAVSDSSTTTEDRDEVLARLKAAIEEVPEDGRLYRLAARLEVAAGNPERATELLQHGHRVVPGDLFLSLLLADILISTDQISEANAIVEQLRSNLQASAYVSFLEGTIASREDRHVEATNFYQEAIKKSQPGSKLALLSRERLANALREIGDADQRIAELKRLIELDPTETDAIFELAETLQSEGRRDEALKTYRLAGDGPQAALGIARLLVDDFRSSPRSDAAFAEASHALDRAAVLGANSVAVGLMRVDLMLARGDTQKAIDLLEQLRKANPDAGLVRLATARLFLRNRQWERFDKALAQPMPNPTLEVQRRSLLAVALAARNTGQMASSFDVLAEGMDKFPKRDQAALHDLFSQLLIARGEQDAGWEQLKQAAELVPDSLDYQFRIALRALKTDKELAEQALGEIERIEGAEGPHTLAVQVAGELVDPETDIAAVRQELKRKLDLATSQRPAWDYPYVLTGRMHERLENTEATAEAYRRAIELGNRDVSVMQTTLNLLWQLKRYDETESLLAMVRQDLNPAVSQQMDRAVAEASVRALDFERGLDLAKQAGSAIDSPAGRVWLAQMQASAGQTDEAKETLQHAVQDFPDAVELRFTLMNLLIRNGDRQGAEQILEEGKEVLQRDGNELLWARGNELVGRRERALELYQQAYENNPDDVQAISNLAQFHVKYGQFDQAEPLLSRLLDPSLAVAPQVREQVKQALVGIYATRGDQGMARALELLEPKEVGAEGQSAQLQQARLLARLNNQAARQKAMVILESLQQAGKLNVTDTVLLSRLYDFFGRTSDADALWRGILESDSENPVLVANAAVRALGSNRLEEASTLVQTLERLQPNQFPTVRLSAELRFRLGQTERGFELLDDYISKAENSTANDTVRATQVLSYVSTVGAASVADSGAVSAINSYTENLYERLIDELPESMTLQYMGWSARHDRLPKAMELCDQLRGGTLQWRALSVMVDAFRVVDSMPEQQQQLRDWLESGLKQEPGSVTGLLALSNLCDLLKDYDAAINAHRQVLELDPENVVSLNNLSWLLSMTDGDTEEALKLIDKAIGPQQLQPSLVDTRGTILIMAERYDDAAGDLKRSLQLNDLPLTRLHLAIALHMSGSIDAAKKLAASAWERGLKPKSLHPLEMKRFSELVGEELMNPLP